MLIWFNFLNCITMCVKVHLLRDCFLGRGKGLFLVCFWPFTSQIILIFAPLLILLNFYIYFILIFCKYIKISTQSAQFYLHITFRHHVTTPRSLSTFLSHRIPLCPLPQSPAPAPPWADTAWISGPVCHSGHFPDTFCLWNHTILVFCFWLFPLCRVQSILCFCRGPYQLSILGL